MNLRIGYDMVYGCPQPVPMILMLNTHYSRASDVVVPDHVRTDPPLPLIAYRDGFGNWCTRIVAPAGDTRIFAEGVVRDTRLPDEVASDARQHAIEELPEETLVYLLGSRYCETDRLSERGVATVRPDATGLAASARHLRLSSIGTSGLDTSSRAARSRPGKPTAKGRACVAITLTSRSRSVAA